MTKTVLLITFYAITCKCSQTTKLQTTAATVTTTVRSESVGKKKAKKNPTRISM